MKTIVIALYTSAALFVSAPSFASTANTTNATNTTNTANQLAESFSRMISEKTVTLTSKHVTRREDDPLYQYLSAALWKDQPTAQATYTYVQTK